MTKRRDPRHIVVELQQLRQEFEHLPKVRAPMFIGLLTLCDELMEWDRALHRWAKEYDARLLQSLEQIGGKLIVEDELEAADDN